MTIEIGRRFDTRPLVLPWASCPHILVGGQTGAGKSGVANAVIAQVAARADTAICGIDLKLVEQWPWRRRMTTCATSTAEADKLLADLRALIQQRATLLQSVGRRMWSSELGPWVLVVVDELAELTGFDPHALVEAVHTGDNRDVIRNGRNSAQVRVALLGSLARLARFCGINHPGGHAVSVLRGRRPADPDPDDHPHHAPGHLRRTDRRVPRPWLRQRLGVRSIPPTNRAVSGSSAYPVAPNRSGVEPTTSATTTSPAQSARTTHLAWLHEAVFGPGHELESAS